MSKCKLNNSNKILRELSLNIPKNKTSKKVFNKDFKIPKFHEYDKLITNDYKIVQLKQICGEYGILKNGKKEDLIEKIYRYLYFSNKIINIQKMVRAKIAKLYINYRGPGYLNRNICVNQTDFYTLEEIKDISPSQFYSYKDVDNFVYAFNILSLYEYVFKKNGKLNPYNRAVIPKNVISDMGRMIRLCKILNIDIDIKIKQEIISPNKAFELRVISLFNKIDELGNYSDYNWFYKLEKHNLVRFIRELYDIWMYRLQLSNSIKRNICPRGDPFRNTNLYNILNLDVFILKKLIISVMEEFVHYGNDNESKSLGAIYILTALTLVSHDAASSLPWLYHSVMPI